MGARRVRPPNVLGVSCTAGPACRSPSGAAAAGNDVRRTEWRNFAWDSVLTLLRHLEDVESSGFTSLDEISGEYWTAAARTVSTALALTQQGVEFILKGLICRVSPLLLIATPVRDWPARAASENVAFADFKTVDALDLPKLHDSVITPPLPPSFVRTYEELRRQRNALLHTIDKRLSISAREVLIAVLETTHYLLGARSWLRLRGTSLDNSPEAVAFSPDFVEGLVIREALLSVTLLERREAEKFFGYDKKRRTYICPNCSLAYRHFADRYAESAQLQPNAPSSVRVWCFICEDTTIVRRVKCTNKDCKGNVIYEDEGWCLTCGRQQDDGAT